MNTPPAGIPPSAEPPAPRWLDWIDRVAMTFAVAIALLLFAQWPLRDPAGSGDGPTQANDLAQWLFALYVAVALRHAGRRGAHLVAPGETTPAEPMNDEPVERLMREMAPPPEEK